MNGFVMIGSHNLLEQYAKSVTTTSTFRCHLISLLFFYAHVKRKIHEKGSQTKESWEAVVELTQKERE